MTYQLLVRNPLVDSIFYIASLVFLVYFLFAIFYYLALVIIGITETKRRRLESEDEFYSDISSSGSALPVSIIVPGRNEEEWIADFVGSILKSD